MRVEEKEQSAKTPAPTRNPDGSYNIPLSDPLDIDGAKVKVLTMREPRVEDQLLAEEAAQTNGRQEVQLFANLCQITPADVGKMKMRDYKRLQLAYMGFTD